MELNYLSKTYCAPVSQLRTQSVSKAYTPIIVFFINACFSTEKILALLFVYMVQAAISLVKRSIG